jgi:hypothetical protein
VLFDELRCAERSRERNVMQASTCPVHQVRGSIRVAFDVIVHAPVVKPGEWTIECVSKRKVLVESYTISADVYPRVGCRAAAEVESNFCVGQ